MNIASATQKHAFSGDCLDRKAAGAVPECAIRQSLIFVLSRVSLRRPARATGTTRWISLGVLVLGLLFSVASAFAQPVQHFADIRPPSAPGDRAATATVLLHGADRADVEVTVFYSDVRAEVEQVTQSTPSGRASCRASSPGRLTCTFLFPHRDHPEPNILFRTEVDGNEPPASRPTLDMFNVMRVSAANPFVKTDQHPRRFGAPQQVHVKWVKRTGDDIVADAVRTFTMPRFLIIANAGDSYASGEGAPNRPKEGLFDDGEGMWDDVPCHRSSKSGQALAVKKLIRTRPDVATRFINVACSGAEIGAGLIGTQQIQDNIIMDASGWRNAETPTTRSPQIQAIREWLQANNRQVVDVLVLSIGGNDAGFGSVGTACIMNIVDDCRDDEQLRAFIEESIGALPDNYDNLDTVLEAVLNVNEVFVLEYPDPTRDEEGLLCRPDRNDVFGIPNPFDCWGLLERSVEQRDFLFVFEDLLTPLNGAVATAADRHGWTFLDGTVDLSRNHGLCNCADPFFHTPGQAKDVQGDLFGSIHPNLAGHREVYQPVVFDALLDFVDDPARRQAPLPVTTFAQQDRFLRTRLPAILRRLVDRRRDAVTRHAEAARIRLPEAEEDKTEDDDAEKRREADRDAPDTKKVGTPEGKEKDDTADPGRRDIRRRRPAGRGSQG